MIKSQIVSKQDNQGPNPDLTDCKALRLFTNHFVSKIYRNNPCLNFSQGHEWIGVWKCHKYPFSTNEPISETEHCVLFCFVLIFRHPGQKKTGESASQQFWWKAPRLCQTPELTSVPVCWKSGWRTGISLELRQPGIQATLQAQLGTCFAENWDQWWDPHGTVFFYPHPKI